MNILIVAATARRSFFLNMLVGGIRHTPISYLGVNSTLEFMKRNPLVLPCPVSLIIIDSGVAFRDIRFFSSYMKTNKSRIPRWLMSCVSMELSREARSQELVHKIVATDSLQEEIIAHFCPS